MLNNIMLILFLSLSIFLLFTCVNEHKNNIYLRLNQEASRVTTLANRAVEKRKTTTEELTEMEKIIKEQSIRSVSRKKEELYKVKESMEVKREIESKPITQPIKVKQKEKTKEKSLSDLEKAILEELKKMKKEK